MHLKRGVGKASFAKTHSLSEERSRQSLSREVLSSKFEPNLRIDPPASVSFACGTISIGLLLGPWYEPVDFRNRFLETFGELPPLFCTLLDKKETSISVDMNGLISQGLHRPIPRPPPIPSHSNSSVPSDPFENESVSTDDADEELHGPGGSINGMESIQPLPNINNSLQNLTLRQPRTFRDEDFDKAVERVWDEMGNKALPPHEPQLMVKQLEKRADAPIRRTYMEGQPCQDGVLDGAVVIKVGLTFMPGADKPQVNRLEQFDMTGKEPDQQDAVWRVNTAASLLSVFEVDKGLSVVQRDQTADVAERARARRDRRESYFSPNTALAHRYLNPLPRCVTIDSAEVRVVNDLRISDEWDMCGTLIEVDGTSLMSLMVHYRQLIFKGGPDMTFEETRNLLDTMIEDARRLCVRSPILFRMSTRAKIIHSKNTRYGINTPDGFTTLTTSKGIQETISLSASYFNSLDPTSRDDKTQAFIRPRFLQMVVLLLSLLNEEDLYEIAEFLETTYEIKAERQHLELLFLKVIPLMSINPKVFLKAMIPAYEGWDLKEPVNEGNYSYIWGTFIQRILQQGYILPGTVDDLGSTQQSWVSKWPREGIKNSMAFDHLQYQGGPGSHTKTFNDIPPIEIRPEASYSELQVYLTNTLEYVIDSHDLELVTCMIKGTYSIQEAKDGGRKYDLIVQENVLNEPINEATTLLNTVIRKANRWLTSQRKSPAGLTRRISKVVRGKVAVAQLEMLKERVMPPRLTQNVAHLNQSILAITYKTDGRRITKRTAMRELETHRSQIADVVQYYMSGLDTLEMYTGNSEVKIVKNDLDRIVIKLNRAEEVRISINQSDKLADEPISKVNYPGGTGPNNANTWHDYHAWSAQGLLHVDAKRSIVRTLAWRTDEFCDVYLENFPLKYTVSPLKEVNSVGREDEIRAGDIALLVGHYMVIAEPVDVPQGYGYSMTNYLRIIDVEERVGTRRGRNREQHLMASVDTVFV